ncbi:MAG TPA: orotate phosphoribosyltransferase [Candidatus Aminicenantes bacterium]|jgi:orotate phosphoribosyltransferase|nr:orotate phosphoribosyltransferase [Candidatus Aminicenantes bacterium]
MKERLKELILEKSVFWGDFTLASGKKSPYYIDARISTLFPESAYIIGQMVYEALQPWSPDAVGGYSIGADPIVTSVALVSHLKGGSLPAFIIRKEAKDHGRGKEIEGNFQKGMRVVLVDDVITTAGSLLKGFEAVERQGGRVVGVCAVLDRQEGGREKIEALGVPFVPLLTLDDLGIQRG